MFILTHFDSDKRTTTTRLKAKNAWGHVNVFAHGAGQALAQLDVSYGVDYEPFKDQPPRDYYNLTIQEYFHGRNKSEVTIKSCFNWNNPAGSEHQSGMTLLAIDIPSGYNFEWSEAYKIIKSKVGRGPSGQKHSLPRQRDALLSVLCDVYYLCCKGFSLSMCVCDLLVGGA